MIEPPRPLAAPMALSLGNFQKEIPPVIVGGPPRRFLFGGIESFACTAQWSLLGGRPSSTACSQVLGPVVDNQEIQRSFDRFDADKGSPYTRNYNGVFAAALTSLPGIGPALVTINHTENKGEARPLAGAGRGPFPNSVSSALQNLTAAGTDGSTCYVETLGCYFGFVTISWAPFNAETNWGLVPLADQGPIVWPSLGYVSADRLTKLANGPRHPHAITRNGYMYVFYIDHFYTNGRDGNAALDRGGRRSGVKLIRAKLPDVAPGAWRIFRDGAFDGAALPSAFLADDPVSFARPGPVATPLFVNRRDPTSGTSETESFAVAKVDGADLFVGAEVFQDWQDQAPSPCPGKHRLALRFATDLVHWSERRNIYGCTDAAVFDLHYATFVRRDSSTNEVIDGDDFYVVGTGRKSAEAFEYRAIRLRLGPTSTRP
ncbi:MAG: hypothetical protein JO228_14585 [Xanthobacteraceae bacterium]|nr:hypothetical protein [Xanthobacteraceae bacterium]